MATHQTIRLIRGKHSSPDRGACVMELASMLAGEPFTDRPECVCPVIAEFLRTYNDEVDERRRRDLYAYASHAVDSSSGPSGELLRADMVLRWWTAHDRPARRWARTMTWGLMPRTAARDAEIAYRAAHFAASSPELHASALALIDDLVSVGRPRRRAPLPDVPAAAPVDLPAPAGAGGLGLRASCARSESRI